MTAEPDDPRKPDSPTDLTKPSLVYSVRMAVREFSRDQCMDLSAALTYFAVLSLFPALVVLVSLLGVFGQGKRTVDTVLQVVGDVAPASVVDTLRGPVQQLVDSPSAGFALAVGLLGALWSASGYVGAFGRAMNRIYEIDEGRPVWKLRPLQLVLTLAGLVLAAAVAVMLTVSGPVASAIGDSIGMGNAAMAAWRIGRCPLILSFVTVAVAVLYYATPNVRQPRFRWISVGAGGLRTGARPRVAGRAARRGGVAVTATRYPAAGQERREKIAGCRARRQAAPVPRQRGVTMTANRVEDTVGRATHSDAFQFGARAGFAVSGVLHLLIGYIILRIAFGSGGTADKSGALATLAQSGGGALVLWLTAASLAALGLWRLAETVVGDGVTNRLKSFGQGVVYLAITFSAAKFAVGSGEASAARNATLSARLMGNGWGKLLLVVIGLGIVAVGGYYVYKGVTKRFLKDLTVSGGPAITPVGIAGYVAKGIVLAGAGILLIVATFTTDPSKASGLDGAVKTLGAAPFGKVLLILAAVGFAAYGLYSFARSRYCRL